MKPRFFGMAALAAVTACATPHQQPDRNVRENEAVEVPPAPLLDLEVFKLQAETRAMQYVHDTFELSLRPYVSTISPLGAPDFETSLNHFKIDKKPNSIANIYFQHGDATIIIHIALDEKGREIGLVCNRFGVLRLRPQGETT